MALLLTLQSLAGGLCVTRGHLSGTGSDEKSTRVEEMHTSAARVSLYGDIQGKT